MSTQSVLWRLKVSSSQQMFWRLCSRWTAEMWKMETCCEWPLHSTFHTHLRAIIIHVKCLLSSTWKDYSCSSTIYTQGWFDAFISRCQGSKLFSSWKKSCKVVWWEGQKPSVFFSSVFDLTFIIITHDATWKSRINKTVLSVNVSRNGNVSFAGA